MKKIALLLVCIVMVFTLAACGGGNSGGDKEGDTGSGANATTDSDSTAAKSDFTVGLVMRTQAINYYVILADSIQQAAETNGWTVKRLNSDNDIQKEAEALDTLISQGVDLIFLDAVEPDPPVPAINKAADAEIPVINVDCAVGEGAKDVTVVQSDNLNDGRLCGLAYDNKFGKDQEINAICVSGMKGSVPSNERRQGMFAGLFESRLGLSEEEALKKAQEVDSELFDKGKVSVPEAKFEVLGQVYTDWSEAQGLAGAEDLITAHGKDLNLILGECDALAFGCISALTNANLLEKVKIITACDAEKRTFDLMKEQGENSIYWAVGVNSPAMIGEKGVEIAKEILVDGKDPYSYPDVILTEPIAVTPENVDQYYDLGW